MADRTKEPPATSGEPDTPADEASARKAAQEAREATAAFDPATGDVNGHGGESLGERAAAAAAETPETPETGTEPDGQDFFVIEKGKRVTLATLYARGTKVTFETQLTGKVLKGPGTLIAFSDPDVMLIVPARAGKVEVDPVYDEDGNVKEVHVRQKVKARTFYDAESEAGQVALRGE